MSTPDDIHHHQTLLATHRRTLAHYLHQQAMLGNAYAPPGVAHGIAESRAGIARCKATLWQWGVAVDDYPDDAEPTSAAGLGNTIHAQGSQGFVNHPTGPMYQHFGDIVHGDKVSGDITVSDVAGQGIAIGHGAQAVVSPGPAAHSTDAFAAYEAGMATLLARLGNAHPRYGEALVFEQRLRENLARARQYGDTREREVARVEVLDRLNDLARATLGVSFNALCFGAE